MPKRKVVHMLLAVTVPSDYHADGVREAVRDAAKLGLPEFDDAVVLRSVRPIPRGSDIARTRYKPRQGVPPLLAYMMEKV